MMLGRRDDDLAREIQTHLELEAEERMADGLSPGEARLAARRSFGNVTRAREEARAVWVPVWIEQLLQDVRYAGRMLRDAPGFAAAVIGTLALGIAGTTTIFSLFDAVLVRPLPYPAPERLYIIHEALPQLANLAPRLPVNAVHFLEWQASQRSFEQLAMVGPLRLNLTEAGEPELVPGARVTPALFSILGEKPAMGRLLNVDDDRPGHDHVVVLDYEFWQRRFNGDAGIVGRSIMLDGSPLEVVGVLSASFKFPDISHLYAMTIASQRPRIWKPFALQDGERAALGDFNYVALGRMRPTVSRQAAQDEFDALQAAIGRTLVPGGIDLRAVIVPLADQIGGRARTGLVLLFAAGALVLLIVCINVSNLLLARGTARRHELAVRAALGASSRRLVRQALVESGFLSTIGGTGGLLIVVLALGVVTRVIPADVPRTDEIQLDARTLSFAVALSTVVALLVGCLPAWRQARTLPRESLAAARGSADRSRRVRLAQSLLVGSEVALSVLCLIAAGLLLRAFANLFAVDRGFSSHQVITVALNLPRERYAELGARVRFADAALDRVASVPGISAATVTNLLPFGGEGANNPLTPEGRTAPILERPIGDVRTVAPGYFSTLGIELSTGRTFDRHDESRRVAIVSMLAARQLWPGENAIGRRLRTGSDNSPLLEVVGIVNDVRASGLDKSPVATVYVPYWQNLRPEIALAVRVAGDPRSVEPAVRDILRGLDAQLPIPAFRTLDQTIDASVAQRRFQLIVVGVFAGVALLLSALGVFGVMAYSVAQRRAEFGVRLAMGAKPTQLVLMVLRQAAQLLAIGLLFGVPAGIATAIAFRGLLFGVAPYDPAVLVGAAVILGSAGIIAALVPAYAAGRVNPIEALQSS